MNTKKLKTAYHSQKCAAKKRGVEFLLSFDGWLHWWLDTGKMELRGKTKGCYQMCRVNDSGAYEIGNIYCDSVENNSKLPHEGKPRPEGAAKKAVATRRANGYPSDPFIDARKRAQDDSKSRAMDAYDWCYENRLPMRLVLRKFGLSSRITARYVGEWEKLRGKKFDLPKRAVGDRAGGKQNAKPVITPIGMFDSAKSASIAYGVKYGTITYRCAHQSQGFSYLAIA